MAKRTVGSAVALLLGLPGTSEGLGTDPDTGELGVVPLVRCNFDPQSVGPPTP